MGRVPNTHTHTHTGMQIDPTDPMAPQENGVLLDTIEKQNHHLWSQRIQQQEYGTDA